MRYIHERPDWPDFKWDLSVLAEPLAAVRYRQGLLLGRVNTPPRLKAEACKSLY